MIKFCNKQSTNLTGYPLEEIINTSFIKFIHPHELQKVSGKYTSFMSGEQDNLKFETTLIHKNGHNIIVELNVSVTKYNARRAALVFIRDITEHKQAEDSIRKERDKAQKYLDIVGVMILAIDENQRVTLINKKGSDILGYKENEIIGKNWFDHFLPDEIKDEVKKVYKKVMAGEIESVKYFENPIITKNGTKKIIQWHNTVLKDKSNNIIGTLSSGDDITEQKKAEEELKMTKSHLEYLLSSVPSVIYSCEPHDDFALTYVSENLVRVLGYTTEELLSDTKFWANHIHPDDVSKAFRTRENLLKKGTIIQEYRFLHKNGTYLWLSDDCTVIRDPKGNPVEIVEPLIDITDKKSLEEQFYQSQKMEAVGRLAGGIAHDFNNLLQTIIGYCDFLLLESEDKDQNQKDLKQIKKAGNRVASLIKQLLTFSRKQSVQPIYLNLNVVISDLIKMLKRLIGKDITLKTILDSKLKTIKADRTHIEQIIMNLSVNARDAMPKGGKLTIRTQNVILDETDCYKISDARPGEFICLSVEDIGIGIDKKIMDHIFEPFFSTKKKGEGTGLGLPTVYGIVKQHEGWINIKSTPGKGTIFKIYLPSYSQQYEYIFYGDISPVDYKGNGERILVVEDEPDVREFAKRALQNSGYVVFDASCVREALDIIKREKGEFDLLLSDVVLPDQSGLILMHQLKILNHKIKIILSSGYTDQKAQWEIIHTEGIDFIQKPYSFVDLLQSVKKSLQSILVK